MSADDEPEREGARVRAATASRSRRGRGTAAGSGRGSRPTAVRSASSRPRAAGAAAFRESQLAPRLEPATRSDTVAFTGLRQARRLRDTRPFRRLGRHRPARRRAGGGMQRRRLPEARPGRTAAPRRGERRGDPRRRRCRRRGHLPVYVPADIDHVVTLIPRTPVNAERLIALTSSLRHVGSKAIRIEIDGGQGPLGAAAIGRHGGLPALFGAAGQPAGSAECRRVVGLFRRDGVAGRPDRRALRAARPEPGPAPGSRARCGGRKAGHPGRPRGGSVGAGHRRRSSPRWPASSICSIAAEAASPASPRAANCSIR